MTGNFCTYRLPWPVVRSTILIKADGGIEIVISANKTKGVPEENWLLIKREDIAIDAIFRNHAPDAEKMKTWKVPKLEILPSEE